MAPSVPTEDFYAVLEIPHDATADVIKNSYRRLALKLHPDHNKSHDATAAFQLLALAYETLKDADKRRAYDLIYPSITRKNPPPRSTNNTSRPQAQPSATSSPKKETLRDKTQIAALEKSKEVCTQQWRASKSVLDSKIFELNREIRKSEFGIRSLVEILKAEEAEEAKKNNWGTWLLSPFYKKVEDSEEEKARKERGRQERTVERLWKERKLDCLKQDLSDEQVRLDAAQAQFNTASSDYEKRIQELHARIRLRENQERWERDRKEQEELQKAARQREKLERERAEKLEKERQAKLRRQREEAEKRRQEQMEAAEKQRQEQMKAARKQREQDQKHRNRMYASTTSSSQQHFGSETSACYHEGWWDKVQGRMACPECDDVWTYMLQCPGCAMKACPKCQNMLRPSRRRY